MLKIGDRHTATDQKTGKTVTVELTGWYQDPLLGRAGSITHVCNRCFYRPGFTCAMCEADTSGTMFSTTYWKAINEPVVGPNGGDIT